MATDCWVLDSTYSIGYSLYTLTDVIIFSQFVPKGLSPDLEVNPKSTNYAERQRPTRRALLVQILDLCFILAVFYHLGPKFEFDQENKLVCYDFQFQANFRQFP